MRRQGLEEPERAAGSRDPGGHVANRFGWSGVNKGNVETRETRKVWGT